jgi:3-hydroxybutyryl-CoA dehydratase
MSKLTVGMDLSSVEKLVTQEDINRYAEVSRDFNPIHVDEKFAAKTPLGGTIAHGMLILGYVSHILTANFGQNWLNSGKLSVRFKTPARPGDTLVITGKITSMEEHEGLYLANCIVCCTNQKGETIVVGNAQVKVKNI